MRTETGPSGIAAFVLVWTTQWGALGAMATGAWVLGIGVFESLDTLALFAVAFLILNLPFAVASPLAGALADRWGQRRTLLVSNVGMLLNLTTLIVLLLADAVGRWQVVSLFGVAGILKGFQLAGLESTVPLLVPKRHLVRANGTRMLLTTTTAVLGPVIAPALLSVFDPVVAIALAGAPVVGAIAVLAVVRIPAAPAPAGLVRRGLLAEIGEALSWLRSRTGLLTALGTVTAISGLIAAVEQATDPLVLGFASLDELALVLAVGTLGMLLTSAAITIWGRPLRLVRGMLAGGAVFAVGLALSGLRPSVVLVCVAAFVALGATPVVMGSVQTILHTKVEPHLLGRAIGVKNSLTAWAHMSGNVIVIVLALTVLDDRDDLGSSITAAVVGTGPDRGYGVLMLAMAVAAAVVVLLGFRSPALRGVQDGLPDVTPEDLAAARTAQTAPAAPAVDAVVVDSGR
jgi:hypothetical protein